MQKRVFIYERVSTIDQSVESQDRVLRQYCEQNGITGILRGPWREWHQGQSPRP